MPFITPDNREKIENIKMLELHDLLFKDAENTPEINVGDRCYYFYDDMMLKWRKERRWTTAHNIYKLMKKEIKENDFSEDTQRAYELAWQVFFTREVMEYEEEKAKENGEIR